MWRLQGYDAYDGGFYSLPGQFTSELDAQKAALSKLKEIEGTQPTEDTDGQNDEGIQDRVFILRPDGTQYRFLPVTEEQQEKLRE